MIKKLTVTTLLATAAITSTAYAQTGQQNDEGMGGIVASIVNFNKDFDTKYGDVYTPSILSQKTSSIMYPQYLSEIQSANTDSAQSTTSLSANTATSNNVSNALTRFVYELHKSSSDTSDPLATTVHAWKQSAPGQYEKIPYKKYDQENQLGTLINSKTGAASDTLYMNQTQIGDAGNLSTAEQTALKKPENTYDNNFNFAALFEPTSYQITKSSNNSEPQDPQLQAANNYVLYAAQSTQNLADGLNLTSLKEHPAAVAKFKTDPNYWKFAMTVRTLVAIRSITIDTLEHLIAERTPHPGWGKVIGDPNKNGTASPLQVEAYQANHRIQDPNWYQSIMKDAPITLQRTMVIELAEIEHQNYQAHLDRERILAALTAANLQSNSASNMALKEQIGTLNTDIQGFLPQAPTIKSDTPPPPPKKQGSGI